MARKGKIIVIEGSDSAGKEVQSRKLYQSLRRENYPVKFLGFPRFDRFFGKIVGRYLRGEFGDITGLSPRLVSLPFALDRFELKNDIIRWLENGKLIVCNRYVGSNLAYMSAGLPEGQRPRFIKWLEELEYKKLGIPREDISIFLHVPAKVGQKLTYQKREKTYMKGLGRGDLHERNLDYLKATGEQFFWLCRNRRHWVAVESMVDEENLRPIEEIHQEIVQILKKRRII